MKESSKLATPLAEELTQRVYRQCRKIMGGGWRIVESKIAAQPLLGNVTNLEQLNFESLATKAPEMTNLDKLFVVTLRGSQGGIAVEVRELDVSTRLWGPTYHREVAQRPRLAWDVSELVVRSFRPVVRLGTAKGKEINVRVRASRLVPREVTPPGNDPLVSALLLRAGDVLQPVRVAKDRHGKPRPSGIVPVSWTLLVVRSVTNHNVTCEIASGLRYPLRGRTGFRLDRIALLARPTMEQTRLRLNIRDQPDQPIRGCEIYAVKPETSQTVLIGKSDRNGIVSIFPNDDPIRNLYVRYGDRVMAQLPILPGWKSEQLVLLPDDTMRLEAEGFVKGIQEQLIDLVVRRKVMAVRIRRRIADEEFDEAEKLLDQLRTLTSRVSLYRQLQERQHRYSSDVRKSQAHIDRIFRQANSQIQDHLSNRLIRELHDELSAARRGKQPPSPSTTQPSSTGTSQSTMTVKNEEDIKLVEAAADH